jgi:hypothetical protein
MISFGQSLAHEISLTQGKFSSLTLGTSSPKIKTKSDKQDFLVDKF